MSLYINSPAYYTYYFGVDEEVYQLCKKISSSIDVKNYTNELDTIGISPIIAPKTLYDNGMWKEEKKISLTYRMASVSIRMDFETYFSSSVLEKKNMILENIINSLSIVERKLKSKFDYLQIVYDIKRCVYDDV